MIVHTRLDSAHLAANLLGDPSDRDLFVYLPPGYETSDRRYPTAYLLHAAGTSPAEMVTPPIDRERWRPPLEDVLDPVFGRLGIAPMIVVVPDGNSAYGCGQWVDSPVTGSFDQFVTHEVVDFVDASYRTIRDPKSRGVFGFSSGGFGAWHVGSRHPEVFGALAMLSGDSYFDLTHKPMLYAYFNSIWPDPPRGPSDENSWSQMIYALAACYSPRPDNPPFFVDLPVSFPSGELIEHIWDKWLTFDPVVNVHERLNELRSLSGILLDVGINDDHDLQWGHRLLSHHLGEAGIPHELSENAGNHGGRALERLQVALAWLAEVLVSS